MNKGSVLIRRAALLTAIALAAAVAVGLSAFAALGARQARAAAREQLLPQARLLAEAAASYAANDSARVLDEVDLFALSGGTVYLTGTERNIVNLTDDKPFPDALDALQGEVFAGDIRQGALRLDGTSYAYAMIPVELSGKVVGVLTALQRVGGVSLAPALIAAALSLIAAGALAALLSRRVMKPAITPIADLRDAAVAMAEGDLMTRAREDIGGELGELGKAVNNLSNQLSRHMYNLIVERNRLKNMLNGLSEAIVAIDATGAVTHTNPALDKFFTRQKLALHLPDPRMKVIPDKSIWEDFDRVLQTGEPLTRNLEARDMTLRMTITPIVDEIGTIAGAVGLFSDITQMERLERTRRDYVSNVNHELRTPLTAMRALVEPLRDGMVTAEADRMRYYDIILREIMRLSRLINDQLELSRLQSGTLSIQKQVMTLDDLVYDVCDRYQAIAAEKGLEVKILSDFGACPPVYTNADRAEQMLIILLDNAIKYTEEGSVGVSASWDDERVVVSVRDTGIGIEEVDLPYVFDRFYKVDKAHSGKGSGLGLSIAKELLKRMDEEIWVTSEKGRGTEFSFTLHRPTEAQKRGGEAEEA